MTVREWANWMDGYQLRLDDEWRQVRTLYALQYNINVEPHNQKSAEELIPLASDIKPEDIKTVSLDERLNAAEKHKKMLKEGKHSKNTLLDLYKLSKNG